jgi:hypothetical protein
VETPRKFITAKLSIRKPESSDEDLGLRIESFAVINLRGVSTNKILVFIAMQTYKELMSVYVENQIQMLHMLLVDPTAQSLTTSLTVRTNFEHVPLHNSLGTPRFQRNHQNMHVLLM